jgi:hypothetical protein
MLLTKLTLTKVQEKHLTGKEKITYLRGNNMDFNKYLKTLMTPSEDRYGEEGTDFASPDDRKGAAYGALANQMSEFTGDLPQVPMRPEDQMEEEVVDQEVNDIVEADNAPVSNEMVEQEIQQIVQQPQREIASEEPELSPQEKMLEEFRRLRKQQEDQVSQARETDADIELLNNMNKAFQQIGSGLGAGISNVKMNPLDIGKSQLGDQALKDSQSRMNNLLQEYKLMSQEERDQLSPRDKKYFEYLEKKNELELQRLGKQEERESRISRKQQLDAARGLIKDDPRTKKAFEQAMALEDIQPLIEQVKAGNQNATAALGTRLARAMGEVGVLTDADVTRYVQGTSWGRKLLDWYKKGAEGMPSEKTLEEIAKNAETISSKLQQNLGKVYKNAESRMKTAYPDMEVKDIRGLLGTPNVTQNVKVKVRLPDGRTGSIDSDKVDAFKKKYPKAEVME